ncbi:MAG: M14 family zinc carboxypeptidase [Candidatus Krumholzibacteriia bacterium]
MPSSRLLTLAVVLVALALPALAADQPAHHALVRFWLTTEADQATFAAGQAEWDVVAGRAGRFADIVVPRDEVSRWLGRGSRVEVLQGDLETYYAERNGNRADYGAYHTFAEGIAWLDELAASYPQVVSPKWSLGWSHEGRNIWCVRVSDNPTEVEAGEPEILFDAAHHAREVMSAEMVLMLTAYLAEQYAAGDPEIVALVDANAIYLVPYVNPDGWVYNELTNPNGGGMWRKNRRVNGDGSYGVDCNRNYPYEWGCDGGSSGTPSSETYRGTAPGSEPEVQAIMEFINAHDFVIRQSFHTYADLTLYPWGYTTADTPDHATFVELAAAMVQDNGYTPGQPGEVLYDVCGGSFDWDYGQQDEHTRIFGFTTEIGDTGFWPTDAERQGLFDENLWPSLYLIAAAADLRGPSFVHRPAPFQAPDLGAQTIAAVIEGFGGAAVEPASVMMHWRTDGGPWTTEALAATGNPGEYAAVIPQAADGAAVEYYLEASDVFGDTGTAPRGAPDVLFRYEVGTAFDHAMEADRGWRAGDPADDASSGLWVRVDPVGTTYDGAAVQPEDDHTDAGTMAWITGQHVAGESAGFADVDGGRTTLYSPVYDLTGGRNVAIRYWRWYTNDAGNNPGEDWWDVELSNDGGQTWTAVEHTQASSAEWLEQQFDLADYATVPGQVQLRFVASDEVNGSLVEAGVDDFLLVGDFGDVTGAEDETPGALAVDLSAVPNPFNPLTSVRFRLAAGGATQMGVFDLRGRLVKSLVREVLPAGEHAVRWNGRDALGRPVASGVYFVRLLTPEGQELSRKLLLAR